MGRNLSLDVIISSLVLCCVVLCCIVGSICRIRIVAGRTVIVTGTTRQEENDGRNRTSISSMSIGNSGRKSTGTGTDTDTGTSIMRSLLRDGHTTAVDNAVISRSNSSLESLSTAAASQRRHKHDRHLESNTNSKVSLKQVGTKLYRKIRNEREKARCLRISQQIDDLHELLGKAGIIIPKNTKTVVLDEAAKYIRRIQQQQQQQQQQQDKQGDVRGDRDDDKKSKRRFEQMDMSAGGVTTRVTTAPQDCETVGEISEDGSIQDHHRHPRSFSMASSSSNSSSSDYHHTKKQRVAVETATTRTSTSTSTTVGGTTPQPLSTPPPPAAQPVTIVPRVVGPPLALPHQVVHVSPDVAVSDGLATPAVSMMLPHHQQQQQSMQSHIPSRASPAGMGVGAVSLGHSIGVPFQAVLSGLFPNRCETAGSSSSSSCSSSSSSSSNTDVGGGVPVGIPTATHVVTPTVPTAPAVVPAGVDASSIKSTSTVGLQLYQRFFDSCGVGMVRLRE